MDTHIIYTLFQEDTYVPTQYFMRLKFQIKLEVHVLRYLIVEQCPSIAEINIPTCSLLYVHVEQCPSIAEINIPTCSLLYVHQECLLGCYLVNFRIRFEIQQTHARTRTHTRTRIHVHTHILLHLFKITLRCLIWSQCLKQTPIRKSQHKQGLTKFLLDLKWVTPVELFS